MATVPSTRTWAAGERMLASYLTDNVNAVLNFYKQRPHAIVYSTAAQSIPNNTATALTFNTIAWDSDVDGGTMFVLNGTKATARYAGYYTFVVRYTAAANATGTRFVEVAVNGVAQQHQISAGTPAAAVVPALEASGEVNLAVGDYIEAWAFQNSGGALNTGPASGYNPSLQLTWSRS